MQASTLNWLKVKIESRRNPISECLRFCLKQFQTFTSNFKIIRCIRLLNSRGMREMYRVCEDWRIVISREDERVSSGMVCLSLSSPTSFSLYYKETWLYRFRKRWYVLCLKSITYTSLRTNVKNSIEEINGRNEIDVSLNKFINFQKCEWLFLSSIQLVQTSF